MKPPIVIAYVKDAPTRIQGSMFDLKQGQTRSFPGGPLGQHRKSITIYNEDNGTNCYVILPGSDPDTPNRIFTIRPNSHETFHTSDAVTIASPDGNLNVESGDVAPIKVGAVQVLEIFYL